MSLRESDVTDSRRLRAGSGVKWGAAGAGVIPAWVADMDFPVADVIRARLREYLDRSDFGYPHWPGGDPVTSAFETRMGARYGWRPRPGRTRVFTDLLQVLQVVIELATAPGDGIAVHVPAYPPFLASIERAGRRIVPLPMTDTAGGWSFDAAGLEQRLRAHGAAMLLLVNPQNPTGRSFTRAELSALASVAARLDLTVMSDEIHADLTYPGHAHTPFASLGAQAASRTVTATSATKAFNIAGLRCAVAHVGADQLWAALEAEPLDYFGTPSTLSRVATVAAWTEADDWLDELTGQLERNRAKVMDWVARTPQVRAHAPQATCLAWLHFSRSAAGPARPAADLLRLGRVRLSDGAEFSQYTAVDTSRFARLNFATSARTLTEILDRASHALAAAGGRAC